MTSGICAEAALAATSVLQVLRVHAAPDSLSEKSEVNRKQLSFQKKNQPNEITHHGHIHCTSRLYTNDSRLTQVREAGLFATCNRTLVGGATRLSGQYPSYCAQGEWPHFLPGPHLASSAISAPSISASPPK
ncbi:hypothetical protein BC835DRAFT_475662 [Cytidiella melzeri]|nr:hypothetical protein BC835DRAFT_475662 [Cytidiella melzeri]